ncbi:MULTISPECIES: molecular chaperone [unclassified Sphingomonas]|uniref:fimbrial biogenesis chaperone n=1 Tax=unclassified Sphingomonas TaxID=196159 RepID=UPI000ABC2ABF|nr:MULTISPECIES: fimbria/pilus periplasmic chaperone [unclassified Sphingomonas]
MKAALVSSALVWLGLALSSAPVSPVLAQTAGSAAQGGGLSVAPVQLTLAEGTRSTSTIVSNPGNGPVTVQVRLFSWTMADDEEVYTPATDAGFSPPLFRLEAGGAQAVRVVAKAPAGPIERSYRLVIDQLPLAGAPGQLQLPVRMILPVFIAPAAGVARTQQLEWNARQDPETNQVTISVRNRGPVHAKFVELAVHDGGKSVVIAPGLAGYALAGQERSWTYTPTTPTKTLALTVQESGKLLRASVLLTQ